MPEVQLIVINIGALFTLTLSFSDYRILERLAYIFYIISILLVPEKHTDFVFPVLAEEWGFAGCTVTLLLYYALLSMVIEIGRTARERFGTFLAVGIGAYFFWQIAINLGGVLGLMPLTGVTLPFLSYGGSSTITILIAVGLLLSISRKRFVF